MHEWLQAFGYLEADYTQAQYEAAVVAMQTVYGLKPDGDAGPITRATIKLPRCGDVDLPKQLGRGCGWDQEVVKFFIYPKFSLGGDLEGTQRILREGFDLYAPLTGLQFEEVTQQTDADIVVGNDTTFEFDGVGRVLAMAHRPCTRPGRAVYVRFDESEPWTTKETGPGILVKSVWLHELGHALGLPHSADPRSLMFPTYNATITEPQVGDKYELAAIYGLPSPSPDIEVGVGLVPGLPYGAYGVSGTMVFAAGRVAISFDHVEPK